MQQQEPDHHFSFVTPNHVEHTKFEGNKLLLGTLAILLRQFYKLIKHATIAAAASINKAAIYPNFGFFLGRTDSIPNF